MTTSSRQASSSLEADLPAPATPKRKLAPLAGLIAVVAIAGFAIGEWMIDKRVQMLESQALHRAEVILENRADLGAGWKDRWSETVAPLVSNPAIRLFAAGVSSADGGVSPDLVPHLQAMMDDFFSRRPEVASAHLIDRNAVAFLATTHGDALSEESRMLARSVFAEGAGPVLGKMRLAASGLVFDFVQPVFPVQAVDEKTAEVPLGALVVEIKAAASLAELLASGRVLEAGERMALVQTGEGGADLFLAGASKPLRLPPALARAAAAFGESAAPDNTKAKVYALMRPVPDTGWQLLYLRDSARLDHEIMSVRLFVDSLVLAMVIVVGAGGAVVVWRQSLNASRALASQYREFATRLDAQHRLLRSINDALIEDIYVLDGKRRVVYANSSFARTCGRTLADCLGRPVDTLLGTRLAREMAECDQEVVGTHVPVRRTFQDPDSEQPRWLSISKVVLEDDSGGLGVVTVCRDVTRIWLDKERLTALNAKTIRVLTSSVAAADPYLANHSNRLEEVVAGVASAMNLSEEDVGTLRTAAALSQIGKLFLPRSLIRSDARLSESERRQTECHIDHALAALDGVDFDRPVAQTLAQLHERLDGSGYPRQLKGDEMTLLGRIIGVSDVFTARTAPRSYRQAAEAADVIAILRDHPEKYDAAVVAALEAYIVVQNAGREAIRADGGETRQDQSTPA